MIQDKPGLAAILRRGASNCGWVRPLLWMVCLVWYGSSVVVPVQAGSILREVYSRIGGNSISDLLSSPNFPNSPSSTSELTEFFEAPTDVAEAYGQRVHGYVVPPVTGNYTFWIATDDGGLLNLSTDTDPANKKAIARVDGWTGPRQWEVEPNQQSAAIRLEAGKPYYVEALMKEGGGGDNLAVRWLRPDGKDEGPIPATYLLPWGVVFSAPKFLTQPAAVSVPEGKTARFEVTLDASGPATVAWYRDGVLIPGATGTAFELAPVVIGDSGAKFKAVATNAKGTAESAEANLTVSSEDIRPTILRAVTLGRTNVLVEFSEPVFAPASGVGDAFQVTAGVRVLAAAEWTETKFLLLTTTPLTFGTTYTLRVSQVRDRSGAGNLILPSSPIEFQATELSPRDVGTPTLGGSVVQVAGGMDVTGGGTDIGGTADQFQFAWEERTGDFDLQTRVIGAVIADPFLHAGIMARLGFDSNAKFAAIFASSPQLGCFFESRSTAGAASTAVNPAGGYPVNYPYTWLRLRRTGSNFDGFASLDGVVWTLLGSVTLSDVPNTIPVGLAVTGQNPQMRATVRFREYGSVRSMAEGPLVRDRSREPLAPSARSTGLVFSEILYHARPGFRGSNPTNDLEFIEIYNAGAIFEDLTGYRISGDIDYQFPAGFILPAGAFVVVAAQPVELKTAYGLSSVLGPFTGKLGNGSGRVRLQNEVGAVLLEVTYEDSDLWPVSADGAGHSIVLARPSWGERDPKAWDSSELIGGSPGDMDPVVSTPLKTVRLNEILAHTDEPQVDFIELYNASNLEVDLGGCILTDDPTTNRFRIAAGVRLPPRSYRTFDQNQLGFRLSAAGETLYLMDPQGMRVLDSIRYGAQENGVAFGRSPDGSPTWRRLSLPTPDSPNAAWRLEPVVINEIHYAPISYDDEDEFVELYNRSKAALSLGGWRFVSGIEFQFPDTTTIPAGGYLVVAKNRARLLSNHPTLTPALALGDYSGTLSNTGERLALARPDQIVSTNEVGDLKTNTIHIVVSEVRYGVGGRWGRWADKGGSSLELMDPNADPLRAASWADSDETTKAGWQSVEFTGRAADAVTDTTRFYVTLLGAGEALVDDIELISRGGTNLLANTGNFENGRTGWTFNGNHGTSSIDSTGAFSGTQCLHVRSFGDGDTGPNALRTPLTGFSQGINATLRARVRWVAGWPEMLFRVRGSPFEVPVRLNVPKTLGTPGARNSRAVDNAGPAIFDVTHTPALPRQNESVMVSARVSDSDGIGSVSMIWRTEPNATTTTSVMRDDGTNGDVLAGDGIYSGTISGRSSGTMIAFRIQATDAAQSAVSARFPVEAPARECLIRWGETIPFGTFGHYHMWNTVAVQTQRKLALDNTYRDCTLVYNDHRVVYNAGFRDKGSPYHGGSGDWAVSVPEDDQIMGVTDRIFGSTGNGGSEGTGLRGRVTAWIARRLGIPYLYAHPIRVYRNGSLHRNISEDLEQPNNYYAENRFPDGADADLYKIAIWFEFDDANSGFSTREASLREVKNTDGSYKLQQYRFNWQTRGLNGTANNFTNIYNLSKVASASGTAYVRNMMNQVDADEWMRVFVFNRILGNWDSWGMGLGQNMFIYKQAGERWKLIPWDLDFILGDGQSTTEPLWGGSDPAANKMFNTPEFRRMLWRAYQEAANTFLTPEESNLQIDARRDILVNNRVTEITAPNSVKSYITGRRREILRQLAAADAAGFSITTSNGADFTSTTQTAILEGTAKFAVVDLEVNGVTYPVEWSDFTKWRIRVPLTAASNPLKLQGRDRKGAVIESAADTIVVQYNGAVADPATFVVINEIQYNPSAPGASFVEIHNSAPTASFNLSGWRLEGLGYTFPEGSVMAGNSYWVLAKDRAGFELAYGSGVTVFDVFPGSLDNGGETLRLIQPGATPELDRRISDVRYDDRAPWPTAADGAGASLQLIDPAADTFRVGNWATDPAGTPRPFTPGAMNSVREAIDPFPLIWINEIQASNVSGPKDNAAEREPWIELYNSGSTPVDVSGYFLTDTYGDPTRWAFPAGTTLAEKAYLIIWADGESMESVPGSLHTNFRLNAQRGSVALVRRQGSALAPAVLDYLEFEQLPPDRAIGSIPDGEPRGRRAIYRATPGAANDPAFPQIQVTLNEFMADNASSIVDPADGKTSDWFELYNAGNEAVDLTGYWLTDNFSDPKQFVVPSGYVIPPQGHLLVWADTDTKQNVSTNIDLHVNFRLDALGEQLALFTPDGVLVDGFSFGAQPADVSEGRIPDGSAPPFITFATPTPRAANLSAGANLPPVLTKIGDQKVTEQSLLNLTAKALDPEGMPLLWSLSPDAPSGAAMDESTGQLTWTPTETQGPGSFSFVIRVTDTGLPPRVVGERITVTVLESNRPPVLEALTNETVPEGSDFSVTVVGTDPDQPQNGLSYSVLEGAPPGLVVDPKTGVLTWTPTEEQGPGRYTVQVRVTDDGIPSRFDTKSLVLTVVEVDNAPVFGPLTPQQAVETEEFSIVIRAVDGDSPPASVVFHLDTKPEGAEIDPLTGRVRWTPTEDQGPGSFVFVVRATETSGAHLSTARSFGVTVAEKNQAPILQPIRDVVLQAGDRAVFNASASDMDRPAQTLNYTIQSGAPAGATLDPVSGIFTWTAPEDTVPTTNTIVVSVADGGPGFLEATQSFKLVVLPRFRVVLNEVHYRGKTAGSEFVEFYNTSAFNTADLSGLIFDANECSFTFPSETRLGPKSFVVIAANVATFRAAFGNAPTVVGSWTGTINSSGTAGLYQKIQGVLSPLSRVTFGRSAPWPVEADGNGSSLQLVDASQDVNRPGNWAATVALAGPRTLVQFNNEWRYFQQGAAPATWSSPEFADGAWPTGRGALFVESAALPVPKSTALTLGQNAYYFRTRFDLPVLPTGATLKLRHVLDDGAVFYLNGQPLTRVSMPEGNVTFATLSTTTVGDATLAGPVDLPATALRVGENVLAVEVHQASANSSDIVMAAELVLEGGSVSSVTPGAPNNATAVLSPFPTLRLNEVLPINATGIRDAAGDRDPWIELVNDGTEPIALAGLFLSDDSSVLNKWVFPAGRVLGPGEFVVIFADDEPAETTAGEFHSNFRLPNAPRSSVKIMLSRMQRGVPAVVDLVSFTVTQADMAFARIPDADTATGVVTALTTPGAANRLPGENRPPVLVPVGNRSVPEGTEFRLTVSATDPDAGQVLTYQFNRLPPGALATGASLSWTPTELQGPGQYEVQVTVTDNGVPPASTSETFLIAVSEVNLAPTLDAFADASVVQGQSLAGVVAVGRDTDAPANSLSYSLGAAAPAGMTVDSATGVVRWTPNNTQGPGVYNAIIRVHDNGSPVRSAESTLRVQVLAVDSGGIVLRVQRVADQLRLNWIAENGRTYRVEYRDVAHGIDKWSSAGTVVGSGGSASLIVGIEGAARFYRVVLL